MRVFQGHENNPIGPSPANNLPCASHKMEVLGRNPNDFIAPPKSKGPQELKRMKGTLVIARHNEDVSWANNIQMQIDVVQKGVDVPNVGREATSYIHWMIHNYHTCEGMAYFVQGGSPEHRQGLAQYFRQPLAPFPFHWLPGPFWITDAKRNPMFPDELELPIDELWHALTGREFVSCYYVPHALFAVSAETIRRKPLEDYHEAYALFTTGFAVGSKPLSETDYMERGPWAMERLWEKWLTL